MNCLKKVFSVIAALMILVGFFLLIGTAGSSDYADEVGIMWNFSEYIPYVVTGLVLMFLGAGITNILERTESNGK